MPVRIASTGKKIPSEGSDMFQFGYPAFDMVKNGDVVAVK